MILRKPYALFIKIFRPIHFVFVICIGALIYNQNRILDFFNKYLYTSDSLVTKNIKINLISSYFYIIPILLIIFSLIMLGIMFRKNKPYKYYFVTIFIYLAILVINVYTANFLGVFENSIVSIKSVKFIHDLILLEILTESFLIVIYIARGLGVNFKKFDFSSDVAKLDIDEKDKEEFELDLKFDFNESKRKRKEKIRKLKYFYFENRFLILMITFLVIIIITSSTIFFVTKRNTYNKEGKEYNLNNFNIIVESTNILNTNYDGIKVTDNYLIAIKVKLKSVYSSKSLYLKDFNLKIGKITVNPTTKFNQYLMDLGSIYNNDNLINEYKEYILVYEIPLKFITSDMYLSYNNLGYNFDIKLNPKNLKYGNELIESNLQELIDFEKSLGDVKFKINNYEINNSYIINYNYCINTNDCLNSIEYLRPSIDENFDKTILKLDIEYTNNTKLNLSNFYKLLNNFGDIYYYKDGKWNIQSDNFEEIISNKETNYYTYIGVDSNIKNSEKIKFVFNIRGLKYEYNIK